MVLNYLVIDNYEEIEKAQSLALDEPKKKYVIRRLVLDINDINTMFVTRENTIEIEVRGFFYELEFNKEIWDKIEKSINAREIPD